MYFRMYVCWLVLVDFNRFAAARRCSVMFVLRVHSAEIGARMFASLGARSGSTEMCSTNGCPAAASADALYLVPSSTGGHTHQSTTTSSMMAMIVIVTVHSLC